MTEQATTSKPEPVGSEPGKIHALTSLRFFAALWVVLYHSVWSFLPWFQPRSIAGRVVGLGYISVSFFFLLSGYILAFVYLRRAKTVHALAFFKARFARVYPLFLLTLVLDTPFLFWTRLAKYGLKAALLKTGATFAANLVMLQAWIAQARGIDNPNWSLSVETLFYLTFPLLGVALWKLRGAYLYITALALYLGGQLLVIFVAQHLQSESANTFPALHLSTFALGILLARWQLQSPDAHVDSIRTRRIVFALASLFAIVGFFALIYWAPAAPNANLCDGLLAPVFGCWIFLFSQSEWLPAKILSARWLVVLGEASFGLYLFHLPVYHLFDLFQATHSAILFPVYIAASIGLSVLSFYFFETPARRMILKSGKSHIRVRETIEAASDAQ